jgi:hypothetical protein
VIQEVEGTIGIVEEDMEMTEMLEEWRKEPMEQ